MVITARKVVCGWWHNLHTAKPLFFGDLHHPLAIYIYMCISFSFMNSIAILESSLFFSLLAGHSFTRVFNYTINA